MIMTYHSPLQSDDYIAVQVLMRDYFDGLYDGEVEKLRGLFHEDAWLKAPDFRRTRDEWLEAVAARPIPRSEGMTYAFRVLSVEIAGDQAMVKADVPLLAGRCTDFLSLLKEEGEWKIVNKMFAAV
jgi:hypothetical protein